MTSTRSPAAASHRRATGAPWGRYADDETIDFDADGGLPPLFFNAAGAMYAYAAARLASLGVDVVTHSQLIGSPKMPSLGITAQQFPSASMLDWRTGHVRGPALPALPPNCRSHGSHVAATRPSHGVHTAQGTAKYWATKLLVEHVRPGDRMLEADVTAPPTRSQLGSTVCAELGTWTFDGTARLSCDDPGARIEAIEFADYGLPTGTCGAYARSSACSSHLLTTASERGRRYASARPGPGVQWLRP